MSHIFRYLHPRYHEAFYCDTEIPLIAHFGVELRRDRFSCPGFWYSIDVGGDVVRTGCALDMYANLAKFTKQHNEVKIRVLTSYWGGDDGLRLMKDYKQCFRRVMKCMPNKTADLDNALGSCYTFELTNLWSKK